MKKTIVFLVLIALLVVMLFTACGEKIEPEWSVEVSGAENAVFTSADYKALEKVEIEAVLKQKDGSETSQKWTGVLFSDLVDAIGAGEYTSVTIEAGDGYAKDYTPDIIDDEMTILGTVLDGEELGEDDGFVQAVAGNQPGNMWIRDVVRIKVNK